MQKDDLISRQAAIEVLRNRWLKTRNYDGIGEDIAEECEIYLKTLPSAQPEIKPIGYHECANAMLKMWIDNVVTDGEYSRIMDKLNSYWRKNDG